MNQAEAQRSRTKVSSQTETLAPKHVSPVITPGEVCSICCIDHMERDW